MCAADRKRTTRTQTTTPLTPRTDDRRAVGYDFNFHAPKSVSVLHALTDDGRNLAAFQQAVDETMTLIEADAQTRVRIGGRHEDRTTGELVWGRFDHFTSRPVDGIPDPHLRSHCFVLNATFDSEEGRIKAGQFRALKRNAPFDQAAFHADLARRRLTGDGPVVRHIVHHEDHLEDFGSFSLRLLNIVDGQRLRLYADAAQRDRWLHR
jgi:hypothetical protein